MSDDDLMSRVRHGDTDAWREFYGLILPVVWREAWAHLNDRAKTEEAVSEAMLALVRRIEELDTDLPGTIAWLRGVIRHKAADQHRATARQQRLVASLQSLAHTTSDRNGAPATAVTLDDLRETLDRMKEVERLVLEWKYIEGRTVADIATRLQQTEKSVESNLYRARREFRRLFSLSPVNAHVRPN